MIFGGIDLTPYLLVTKVTRPIVPKVRLDETEVPGMDGSHIRATGLEPVEIAVDCNIVGGSLDEVAEARAVLASALSGGEKALVLDDAPERYMLARYRGGAEQGRNAHMPNLTLAFYCADPAAYGQRRSEQVTASQRAVAAGGNYRAYPTVTCKPRQARAGQSPTSRPGGSSASRRRSRAHRPSCWTCVRSAARSTARTGP